MANTLLTINMITREAVRLWKNSNAFVQHVDMQYDDSFAKTGAKIGSSLRIRLPNDFTVRTGPAAQIQDTAEQSTTLVLATQKGVDVSFNSVDRTMSLDDFSRRILAPMVNNLSGAVAADVMSWRGHRRHQRRGNLQLRAERCGRCGRKLRRADCLARRADLAASRCVSQAEQRADGQLEIYPRSSY